MKMNGRMASLAVAFENLTGDDSLLDSTVVVGDTEANVDVIDFLDGQDCVDELQTALLIQRQASDELSMIVEVNEDLEAMVEANSAKITEGTATVDDVIAANEALAQACALYNVDRPVVCSFEEIGSDPVKALQVANEGIGETISNGFKAVIEWFKKFFAGIWKFIKGLFGQNEDKKEQAEASLANASQALSQVHIDQMKAAQDAWKNNPAVQKLNGQLEDVLSGNFKESKLPAVDRNIIQHGAELIKSFKILGIISNVDVKDLKSAAPAIEGVVKRIEVIKSNREKFTKKSVHSMVSEFEQQITKLKNHPDIDKLTMDNLKDSEVMKEIISKMTTGSDYYLGVIKNIETSEKVDLSEVIKVAEEIVNSEDSGIMHFSLVPKIGQSIRNIDKGIVHFKSTLLYCKVENKINFHHKQIDGTKTVSIELDLNPDSFLELVNPDNMHDYKSVMAELDKGLKSIHNTYTNYDRINKVMIGRIEDAIKQVETLLNGNEIIGQLMNINAMFSMFKAEISENMLERDSMEKIVTALYATINHFRQLADSMAKKFNGKEHAEN